jgi:hypothetical protein
MQRALVQTWRKASLLVDSLEVRHSLLWASHLARVDEFEPSITGVFLCAPPFSDQVNDGTGKMDLVRVLSKDEPDQQARAVAE